MELIDIHTHIYPDPIARRAAASIRGFYELGTHEQDGTVQTLLHKGTIAGISRFVVLPVAVKAENTRHINNFILDQVAEQPRFIGFGTLHACQENPEEEADYIIRSGLHGVKIHPDTQHFSIDDPRLYPAYDRLQGNLPVLFHMGDSRYNFSHPVKLLHLLQDFPRLQVVAAHFGGYRMYETAMEYLKDAPCIFDVSSSLMFMPKGLAEQYIRAYGAERMAFGTDYPLWDPINETKRFFHLDLTDAEFEQISHKTVKTLLNLT